MNILLIGNGGREHALAWKLRQSSLCEKLYIAPGNAGTALCGENLPVGVTDFDEIKKICLEKVIDMVIPGPEVPLVEGIKDYLRNDPALSHIPVIGPGRSGAQLEGSKAFAKAFMQKNHIPTAAYEEFDGSSFEEGKKYIQQHSLPVVLKADGLAAGKGVLICDTHQQALTEFEQMLGGKFGDAGNKVVVEQFLDGIELSIFVLTDGKDYLMLPEAKDYKRIGVGDTGLNTGGMGAVSPVPFADDAFLQKIEAKIIQPTIQGIQSDRLDYTGFIFFGLIKVGEEPYVIEYNCRMGDPETEVIIPRILNDLGELLAAVAKNQLAQHTLQTSPLAGVTTIVVSGGYPEAYRKGLKISIPETSENETLFYAGAVEKEGNIVTSGGRVMAATVLADDLQTAMDQSKELAEKIVFEGKYFRQDIGWEFR